MHPGVPRTCGDDPGSGTMTTNFLDNKSAQVQQPVTGGDVTYIGSSQIFSVDEQGNNNIENFPGYYVLARTSKDGEFETRDEKTGGKLFVDYLLLSLRSELCKNKRIHPDTEADDVKRLAIILASADLLIDLLEAGEIQVVDTLLEQILDRPPSPSVM